MGSVAFPFLVVSYVDCSRPELRADLQQDKRLKDGSGKQRLEGTGLELTPDFDDKEKPFGATFLSLSLTAGYFLSGV